MNLALLADDEIAASWNDQYIECRMDRHDLKPLSVKHDRENHVVERSRLCTRCGTEVNTWIAVNTGEIVKRWNDYSRAEGYLRPKGSGRMSVEGNNVVRREFVSRLLREIEPPRRRAAAANGNGRRRTTKRTKAA